MATLVDVVNAKNETVDRCELPDAIFAAAVKPHVLHDVVRMQLANRRQGTADTKGRSEVSGGGKKPWKQKHTGRARVGTKPETCTQCRGSGQVTAQRGFIMFSSPCARCRGTGQMIADAIARGRDALTDRARLGAGQRGDLDGSVAPGKPSCRQWYATLRTPPPGSTAPVSV